jgi:hypothetical protein
MWYFRFWRRWVWSSESVHPIRLWTSTTIKYLEKNLTFQIELFVLMYQNSYILVMATDLIYRLQSIQKGWVNELLWSEEICSRRSHRVPCLNAAWTPDILQCVFCLNVLQLCSYGPKWCCEIIRFIGKAENQPGCCLMSHVGKHDKVTIYIKVKTSHSRLGGVVVSVLATGPKGCRFKTRPRLWIFKGDKNLQHTFLSDGK